MIIRVEATFPRQHVVTAVQLYMGLEKLPEHIELTGPFFKADGAKNIHTLAIYRFQPERHTEVEGFLAKRYATFADIPDFQFAMEKWDEYHDSLKRLGVI